MTGAALPEREAGRETHGAPPPEASEKEVKRHSLPLSETCRRFSLHGSTQPPSAPAAIDSGGSAASAAAAAEAGSPAARPLR